MNMRPSGRKPAPFQRPGIDVGHHGREWKDVAASELCEGDIVADCGLVVGVERIEQDADDWFIQIDYLNTSSISAEPYDIVKAFVRKEYNG